MVQQLSQPSMLEVLNVLLLPVMLQLWRISVQLAKFEQANIDINRRLIALETGKPQGAQA